ncbi:MAG: PAS domain-containing protein [Phycisphaerae bacterium]|nr:PAS domain-containing protein [Phycisphaerae bacterium]
MPTNEGQPFPTRLAPEYLDALFSGSRLAIIACRTEGDIIAWNGAARQLFPVLDASWEGRPIGTLFPDDDRTAVDTHLHECVTSREPVDFRLRFQGDQLEPSVYAVWWTPVLQTDGTMHGLSLWFRDITQRARLKQEVEKRQRLGVLGSLAGAVAHHYNNLLCSILTSLDFAANMGTTSAMKRAMQRTADVVSRGAEMTQQLLAFAQADHREQEYADLTELVLQYIDENEPRIAQAHVKLRLDWHRIPVCSVPHDQMSVVLDNLVHNALDAMPNGGTLALSLGQRDDTHVSLAITDSGPGIPPGVIEHMFEPFFTTKGVLGCGAARNAGMGLAVVHGFVAEMGGVVSAGNLPGAGARFEVVLPIKDNH